LAEEGITMINQPWASRNWFTYKIAYTSGTNDVILTLSEHGTTTFDLNTVTSWSISQMGGPDAAERWGWQSGQTRTILTISAADTTHTLYDDPQEEIFQIAYFFKAMRDARLM